MAESVESGDDSEPSRQAQSREHRELGLCVQCNLPIYKGWRCEKHYEEYKITKRQPSSPAETTNNEPKISRQALWQRKHRALGLCVLCSLPAYKGWRCEKHYEAHKIAMRLRYTPTKRGRYEVGGGDFAKIEAEHLAKKEAAGAQDNNGEQQTGRERYPSRAEQPSITSQALPPIKNRPSESRGSSAQRLETHLDPNMIREKWDPTANVTFNRALWEELTTLRFIEARTPVVIVGPVGTGKTFLANALGWLAVGRGLGVLYIATDDLLEMLRQARRDERFNEELDRLLANELLIVDAFGIGSFDAAESRDLCALLDSQHRCGSLLFVSKHAPAEWLSLFADRSRAESTLDRFANSAYDLIIEGESYRKRQKPSLSRS